MANARGEHQRLSSPGSSPAALVWAGIIAAAVLLLVACGTTPASTPTPTSTPVPSNGPTEPTGFEREWEDLIAAAQAEGRLIVTTGSLPEYNSVFNAFSQKFGIQVITDGGSGSERTDRILAERSAGRYEVDVGRLSVAATTRRLEPAGALASLPPLLIHPEVTDTSLWYGNRHWYVDAGDTETIFVPNAQAQNVWTFWYNTDELSEQDVASLQTPGDFLDDRWIGKMADQAWHDPGRVGGMLTVYFAPDAGPDWIRRYMLEMDVSFTQDERLEETWLVRGAFPLKFQEGNIGSALRDLVRQGLPIRQVEIPRAQGVLEARGSEPVVIFDRAPHPNAAKLFVNWLLSVEGQTLHNSVDPPQAAMSLRLDVPPLNTDPPTRRLPDMDYSFRDFDEHYRDNEAEARDFIISTFEARNR